MARAFLLELLETLKGNSKSHVQTSVKWDGAPAIFAGINPENGKFFVGTKSIFNKVPKINYTEEDIINNHGHAPGLVDKLTKALRYLPSLGINNILQGDFMFDDEMLDVVEINGEPHYRFKPNTIVYAVPVDSDLGREIEQAKFGIVFHTTYDGLDSGASFGADVSQLNRVPGIWFDDAFFTDDTGTVTLTENEERRVISLVEKADAVNEKIDYNDLPSDLLNIYINSEIKAGQFLEDPENSFVGFISWYSSRLEKKIDTLKSEKGKMRATGKGQEALQSFENKKEDILQLFRVSRLLFEAKNIFIEKYNNAVYNTKHFVEDGTGDLVVSNPEGYVAVDHAGNGVKFVDRLEFSRANFAVDKSAKFVQENIKKSNKFTIQVSKDRQITKSLGEWFKEIKATNHKYQKPPTLVYNDILAGVPIVEVTREDHAQATIYNTVLRYAAEIIVEQDEGEDINVDLQPIEPLDNEDADPVGEEASGETVALIPGAFKPPTRGHLGMVEEYLNKEQVDRVVVLISQPTRNVSKRNIPGGREVTANDSINIWKKLANGYPEEQVSIQKSPMASSFQAALEYIGQVPPGTNVVLGASEKLDDKGTPDWHRWFDTEQYANEGVQVFYGDASREANEGGDFAASIQRHSPHYMKQLTDLYESELVKNLPSVKKGKDPADFHASDMRYLIGQGLAGEDSAYPLLEDFVGGGLDEFDLAMMFSAPKEKNLAEITAMGMSAVAGPGNGPATPPADIRRRGKPKRKKEKSKKSSSQEENLDLSMVDEVMRLFMERGIMQ
jgi:ribosomal protein L12E/L44/L45/RPP1/RPP2